MIFIFSLIFSDKYPTLVKKKKKAESYILEHCKGEVGWRNGYGINIHYKFQISYQIPNFSTWGKEEREQQLYRISVK